MSGHLRIRASAGTGKTFRLTDRIIELLLAGAPPDKIIALTFTRKAAGEFLNKTLVKLAGCASRESEASAFAARRGLTPPPSCADFLRVLRSVAGALDRMEFGTLDSFLYRIVSAFGTELGLGAGLRLQDEISQMLDDGDVRRELANRMDAAELAKEMLRIPGRAKMDPLGAEFEVLNKIEQLFQLYPESEAWGDPSQIWAGGCPWTRFETGSVEIPETCPAPVADAIQELLEYTPGGRLNAIAKRLLENGGALISGQSLTFEYRRKKITISGSTRNAACQAVGSCLWKILKSNLAQSRRWRVIASTLREIRRRRMREGLRFADLPVLVAELNRTDSQHLQFRLDGWFDHWLMDEFQDTSRIQWRALGPLVDEVLQDAEGRRTFFYVGDVKQSIYRFRDGDPTLFEEIFHRYTAHAPEHIRDETLGESRRSSPEVIDLVQKTFSPDALKGARIENEVVKRWEEAWTPHTAHETTPRPGRVHAIHANPENYWEEIAQVIQSTRVLETPPLTCAILVRKNDQAREAVAELAQRGIPATTESSPRIAHESPAGVALLMAARLVARPFDDLARGALSMGPLADLDVSEALQAFHLHGAAGMVAGWLRELRRQLSAPDFDAIRPDLFRRAAREFDDKNLPSPSAFAEFLEAYSSPASARPGTVQVMTIHKSKGLEFDLVFLPVFRKERLDKRDGADIFCGDERNLGPGTRPWILALPREDFCQADAVLCRAGQALRDRATFDNLCALYVAETRARRALVLLTPDSSHG